MLEGMLRGGSGGGGGRVGGGGRGGGGSHRTALPCLRQTRLASGLMMKLFYAPLPPLPPLPVPHPPTPKK